MQLPKRLKLRNSSACRYVCGIAACIISYQHEAHVKRHVWIAESPMWRGLIGLLFVVAAIGCFVGARYAPEATNMYILIDLGCAALAGAVATQVPGAAAFFYSYIAVLVVTLGVNGFFVLAASLAIASALSYSAYHYLVSGSMSRLPEPDHSGLRGH